MLSHLRNNLVGYLALVIALAGTSYAAGLAPNSVGTKQLKNGAVVTAKLKKDAVTGGKVKNGTITVKDLKVGTVKSEFVFTENNGANDPAALPDNGLTDDAYFTLPRAGTVLVEFFSDGRGLNCTAGDARIGLYLDGVPIPDTAVRIGNVSTGLTEVSPRAVVPMAAGAHVLKSGMDCPLGNHSVAIYGYSANWSVTLIN